MVQRGRGSRWLLPPLLSRPASPRWLAAGSTEYTGGPWVRAFLSFPGCFRFDLCADPWASLASQCPTVSLGLVNPKLSAWLMRPAHLGVPVSPRWPWVTHTPW